MVTAEFAVCLLGVVAVLAAVIGALNVGLAKAQCVDSAYRAARAAARGEAVPQGDAGNADVAVTTSGDETRATATVRTKPLGPLLPAIQVTATAVAQREPGAP